MADMTGVQLAHFRKLLKLTQAEMASSMGFSLRQYHRYESSPAPLPQRVLNAAMFLVGQAEHQQKRVDGQFKKPIDFRAQYGKPLFVYQSGREVGQDGGCLKGDPCRRPRVQSLAAALEQPVFKGRVNADRSWETDDEIHVVFVGSTIPA